MLCYAFYSAMAMNPHSAHSYTTPIAQMLFSIVCQYNIVDCVSIIQSQPHREITFRHQACVRDLKVWSITAISLYLPLKAETHIMTHNNDRYQQTQQDCLQMHFLDDQISKITEQATSTLSADVVPVKTTKAFCLELTGPAFMTKHSVQSELVLL